MKHLKAKDSYMFDHSKKYDVKTMSIDEIVPASIYDEIPDRDELEKSITDGEMDFPLMLWPMTQDYWKKVHLNFYKRGNPTLPETAPEKDGQVLVVWKGRQRYQLAKEMGYTHIDCVIEKEQHKIVAMVQKERDQNV
tara:strand:+ start:101 stop:511 length:411 start_codon:yes stop_codon:yes gene_type:complete